MYHVYSCGNHVTIECWVESNECDVPGQNCCGSFWPSRVSFHSLHPQCLKNKPCTNFWNAVLIFTFKIPLKRWCWDLPLILICQALWYMQTAQVYHVYKFLVQFFSFLILLKQVVNIGKCMSCSTSPNCTPKCVKMGIISDIVTVYGPCT